VKGVSKHGPNWRVDAIIDGERLRRGGFTSRESAVQWLEARRAGIPEAGRTVSDVLAFYLEHRTCKTQERQRQLAAHLRRHMGERPAQSLRQVDVDDYAAARTAERASKKTAWNELGCLRAACRYAWRNDLLPEPPKWGMSKPASVRRRVAWQEEAAKLVAAADVPLRRVVLAAFTRGLRRSEIIDAQRSWLHGDTLLIPTTKNGMAKEVPLSPALLALLEEEPRHPVWLFAASRRGRNGKRPVQAVRWTKTQLRRAWAELCTRCGVTDLRIHDLRRSMASVGLSLGHSVAAVQSVGGWADQVALLRHYSHAQSAQATALGEDLERAVLPALRVVQGGKAR